MKILAIETSCDETAIALMKATGKIENLQFKILKSVVLSQVKIHRPYGGIVPYLAKREHLKNLPILFKSLKSEVSNLEPDLIAVTVGPGLEPCLWQGINFAKTLLEDIKKEKSQTKLIGVNHLEGHLYSFLLEQKKINFPAVALIVSGGHTILLLMKNLIHFKKLGETRDDAAGEAFDKVGRLIGLKYPAGPEIEKLAKKGKTIINFPRPMINQKNYDFSFSGLKTAVYYFLKKQPNLSYQKKADIAISVQKAIIEVLTFKTIRAVKEFKTKSVILTGGVAANKALRNKLKKEAKKINCQFYVPKLEFCTDNAVMIAIAGYINYLIGKSYPLKANGYLPIKIN